MLWASIILAHRTEIIILKWDKQAAVSSTTCWDSEEISAGENKIKIVLQFWAAFSVVFRWVMYSHIDFRQVDNSADCNDTFFPQAY